MPVIPTVAVRKRGLDALTAAIGAAETRADLDPKAHPRQHLTAPERRLAAHHMAEGTILSETAMHRLHAQHLDVLLHPWLGPLILFALLFVIFQAVFAWATPFADALDGGVGALIDLANANMLRRGILRDPPDPGACSRASAR